MAPTLLVTTHQTPSGSTIESNVPIQVPSLSSPNNDNQERNRQNESVDQNHYQVVENNLVDKIKLFQKFLSLGYSDRI